MTGIAYVDGKIVPLAEATIPLMDRGHLLGDGVFETMRAHNGAVWCLDEHAQRMQTGLRAIGLDEELISEFHEAVAALLDEAGELGPDLYIRVQISTGPMADFGADRGLLVTGFARPFKPYPSEYLQKGIDVIFSTHTKNRFDRLATIKSLSYLPYVTARREAMGQAVHDAIFLNDAGRVAEGTTSNVFAVVNGTVHAPGQDEGALPGVTRQNAIKLLVEAGHTVEERLTRAELLCADEVWLTNTTGGAIPVRRVQDYQVRNAPGEICIWLQNALNNQIGADSD